MAENAKRLFENSDQSELLTYEECATILRIPMSTLYKLVHRREIPFSKIGPQQVRFIRKEVADWLLKGGTQTNGTENQKR